MAAMPLPFLFGRLFGLLSLIVLATGIWFVVDWLDEDLRSDAWLWTGAALIALSLFGRLPMMLMFRKEQDRSLDMPQGTVEAVGGAGGSRIHIECFGPKDGKPIVLTHGWGLNRTIWARTIRNLSQHYKVVVWDLPGLGKSSRPLDGVYSLERFACDLKSVLTLADGQPAILVGHSIGGMTILTLARDHPELFRREVAGVALVNTTSMMPLRTALMDKFLLAARKPLIEPMLRVEIWLSPVMSFMNWVGYMNGTAHLLARFFGFGDHPSRQEVDHVARLSAKHPAGVQAKGMCAMLRWDAEEVPARLQVPTLVIGGKRDLLTRFEASEFMAQAAPQGELETMEEAGHCGLLELSELYDECLHRFSERVFDRIDQLNKARHADQLRRSPEIWDEAHRENRTWDDEAPSRRADEDGRPHGRA